MIQIKPGENTKNQEVITAPIQSNKSKGKTQMRLVKFLVNWLVILLTPFWLWPLAAFLFISDLTKGNDDSKQLCSGKKWFWE